MVVNPLNHLPLPASRRVGERPEKTLLLKETFRFNLTVNMINMISITLKTLLFASLICWKLPSPIECSTISEALETVTSTVDVTTDDPFRFLLLCAPGTERRNTCEKCTKVTKDPKTYKMCCDDISGVRQWCRTFLDYTVPPRLIGIVY